jgi:hypothetical protein
MNKSILVAILLLLCSLPLVVNAYVNHFYLELQFASIFGGIQILVLSLLYLLSKKQFWRNLVLLGGFIYFPVFCLVAYMLDVTFVTYIDLNHNLFSHFLFTVFSMNFLFVWTVVYFIRFLLGKFD